MSLCIKINPSVMPLLSGDHDGDCLYVICPTNRATREMLPSISVRTLFSGSKEFRTKVVKKFWQDREDIDEAIGAAFRASSTGQSISFDDLLGKEGYFTNTGVDTDKLAKVSKGIGKEELCGTASEMEGLQVTDAVASFRVLKKNTAIFHSIAEVVMQLTMPYCLAMEDKAEARKILDQLAWCKHILAQTNLSAKHGNEGTDNEIGAKLLNTIYQRRAAKFNTQEEMVTGLKELGIREDAAKTFAWAVFEFALAENVHRALERVNPTFIATRRVAGLKALDGMCEDRKDGLHDEFLKD